MGLSLTQQAMGTPYYMAPEQTRSAKDVGPQADVWSLGVTLYQLATGRLPYQDTDLFNLVGKIRNDPVPDVKAACPGVSDGICALIAKTLSKDPAALIRAWPAPTKEMSAQGNVCVPCSAAVSRTMLWTLACILDRRVSQCVPDGRHLHQQEIIVPYSSSSDLWKSAEPSL